MKVRHIPIATSNDLKTYLQDAEREIDACSEADLERIERALESRIKLLVSRSSTAAPPVSFPSSSGLRLIRKSYPKRWVQAGFTGLLMAAMALILVQHSPNPTDATWQTKGLGELPGCPLAIVQTDRSGGELSEAPFAFDPAMAVYVKSPCENDLRLERQDMASGQWIPVLDLQSMEGFASQGETLLDFRPWAGETLRLRSQEGASETFVLVPLR